MSTFRSYCIYVKGVTSRSAEGESFAFFYSKYYPCMYVLYKLVEGSWQPFSSGYSSRSTVVFVRIDGKFLVPVNKNESFLKDNVFRTVYPSSLKDIALRAVHLNVSSLKDMALRKVVSCWNNKGSFKSFVDALDLLTFMKRQYFGINSE